MREEGEGHNELKTFVTEILLPSLPLRLFLQTVRVWLLVANQGEQTFTGRQSIKCSLQRLIRSDVQSVFKGQRCNQRELMPRVD